jgi:UDP-2,4-diacetamido-2,4,6-trideoxy-beta-L-altropyranose hydrolase
METPSVEPEEDLTSLTQVTRELSAPLVVLDGYHFGEGYQREVKRAVKRLVVIDDLAQAGHYWAEWVLNPNLGAETLRYSCEPYTRLLLGPKYVLLRREFEAWQGRQRTIPEVARHVLVTLGGSDPPNATLKVIQALSRLWRDSTPLETAVVVGADNRHRHELERAVERSGKGCRLLHDVRDMARWMAWADLAVCAGGTTCWELAFMGVPGVMMVLADNQSANAARLHTAGVFQALGEAPPKAGDEPAITQAIEELINDRDRRGEMSARGRALVDGQGCRRVVAALREDDIA